jgi:xanthine dehydrogenase FAD-binding subunit
MAGLSRIQKIYNPKQLSELDALLGKSSGKIKFIAGATDLMVDRDAWRDSETIVDLSCVDGLTSYISVEPNGIMIGAGVPMSDIMTHPEIQKNFPMLIETCRQIGSVQIQNRATLGGNIANASPAGDTLPVLAVYQAEILVGPTNGTEFERFSIGELMQGPGQINLNQNQYIAYLFLPFSEQKNKYWYFRKVGMRHAMAISKVSLAVLGWKDGDVITDIRICAGSVSPKIEPAKNTEIIIKGKVLNETLIAQAGQKILEEIDPIDDIRSTRSYRQRTCQALLSEALTQLLKRE